MNRIDSLFTSIDSEAWDTLANYELLNAPSLTFWFNVSIIFVSLCISVVMKMGDNYFLQSEMVSVKFVNFRKSF